MQTSDTETNVKALGIIYIPWKAILDLIKSPITQHLSHYLTTYNFLTKKTFFPKDPQACPSDLYENISINLLPNINRATIRITIISIGPGVQNPIICKFSIIF